MRLKKFFKDVISHNILIKYQYSNDGNYVAKHFYYPVENGIMKLINTFIMDADDNIVEVIIYDNNGNIFEYFMKVGFSGYLHSIIKKGSIYYFKFKELNDEYDNYYLYVKCYRKEKTRYLKYYTSIYKNQILFRYKTYNDDGNLTCDKTV